LLENADISTKGVIKKRPGYAQYGGAFPVRLFYNKSIVNTDASATFELEYQPILYPNLTFYAYHPTNIVAVDLAIGYQTVRDLRNTHVLVKWEDNTSYPNTVLNDEMYLKGEYVGAGNPIYEMYPFQIVKVIGSNYFVITWTDFADLGILANKGVTENAFKSGGVGLNYTPTARNFSLCKGYHPPYISEDMIESVVLTVATTTIRITFKSTVSTDWLRDNIFDNVFVAGGYARSKWSPSVSRVHTLVGKSVANRYIDVRATASFEYAPVLSYLRMHYFPGNLTTVYSEDPQTRALTSAPAATYLAYSPCILRRVSPIEVPICIYGTGVNTQKIQSLSPYHDLATDSIFLAACNDGVLYTEAAATAPSMFFNRSTYSSVDATYTPGIDGYVDLAGALTASLAGYQLQAGDILKFTEATATGVTTTYSMTVVYTGQQKVTSITSTVLGVVTNLTNITLRTNARITITRTSTWIDSASVVTFPVGTVFTLNTTSVDSPSYRLVTIFGTLVILDREVTFSSDDIFYAQPRWLPLLPSMRVVASPSTNYRKYIEIDSSEAIDTTTVQSSIPFASSLVHTSPSRGIWRYLGSSLINETIPKPEVISLRSVKGSKGFIPAARTGRDQRIGQQVSFIFTYSFVDSVGRTYESRATEQGEAVFTPEACLDGSEVSELIQVMVKAPPTNEGSPYPFLINVYRSTIDVTADTKVDFRLEKTVDLHNHGGTITFIVGDTSFINPAGRRKLYTLDEGNNVPAPRCKFLMSSGNRLIGLGVKSQPYLIVEPLEVFYSSTSLINFFKAYSMLSMAFPKITSGSFSATADFTFKFQTMPFGYDLVSGVVPADKSTVSGFPASTFSDFAVLKLSTTSATHTRAAQSVAYADTSHAFYVGLIGTGAGRAATRMKLRPATPNFPKGTSIDFLGDSYKLDTTVASTAYLSRWLASTKWTDSNLATNNVPRILNNQTLAMFEFVAEYTSSQVLAQTAFISGADNKTFLYFSSAASGVIASILNLELVIHGPGTLGGYKADNDTEIKTWERDLTFKAAAASSTAIRGTATFATLEITPVKLIKGATFIAPNVSSSEKLGTVIYDPISPGYSMAIYTYNSPGGVGTSKEVTVVSGFSTPSTVMTINSNTVSSICAVGDFITLNISDADSKLIPPDFPPLRIPLEVLTVATNSLTVAVINSFETFTQLLATTLTFASSYVSSTRNMFTTSATGDLPNTGFFGIDGTISFLSNTSIYRQAFLIVRGRDYNSVNFDLSGWYTVVLASAGRISLIPKFTASLENTLNFTKHVSDVTESYLLVAKDDGVVPIPVPYKLGLAESLSDLALPYFTTNPLLTNNPLVQISKRFSAALGAVSFRGQEIDGTGRGWNVLGGYGSDSGFGFDVPGNAFFAVSLESANNAKMRTYEPNSATTTPHPYSGDKNSIAYFDGTLETFDQPMFRFRGEATSYKINAAIRDSSRNYSVDVTVPAAAYGLLTFTYRVDNFPNAFVWSGTIASAVVSNLIPTFKENAYHDLGSQDGTQLTGGTPFQNSALMFKSNSVYAVTFGENLLDYNVRRLQTTVGAFSHHNLPVTDSYCYFLHDTGPHYTDGTNVEPMFKLNKVFDNYTIKDRGLFTLAAGYTDTYSKNVYLGAPYVSPYSSSITNPDAQYNYSYNDGVLGWQVNTRIDSLKWVERDGRYYFASTRGFVGKMRTETELTRFNDYDSPIPFALRTRYTPNAPTQEMTSGTGANVKFKFWRNAIFQFGNTSDFSMAVYYMENYKTAEMPLETYNIVGADSDGSNPVYGTDRYVKTLRDTLGKRTAQIAFVLREESADTDCPIYHVSVEGLLLNTRLIPQKATRAGDR
jgi:hypothetical protein